MVEVRRLGLRRREILHWRGQWRRCNYLIQWRKNTIEGGLKLLRDGCAFERIREEFLCQTKHMLV